MPKPDRWTRRGQTQEQVDRALVRIGEMQDDPSVERWYRDGGALRCDSILMLDEIMRLRNERKGLVDALLHICAGDWDLSTDEIAIAALAAVGVPWPPSQPREEIDRP